MARAFGRRREAAPAGWGRPSLEGAPAWGGDGGLARPPRPAASRECGGSAPSPSGIPDGRDGRGSAGPQAPEGHASASSGRRDWGLPPRRVADVRSGTPGTGWRPPRPHPEQRRAGAIPRSPPRSRPPVQSSLSSASSQCLQFVTLRSHLHPRRRGPTGAEGGTPRGRGRGRGAKGAEPSLKGPGAAALRPLPGGGEDLSCCWDAGVRRRARSDSRPLPPESSDDRTVAART